MSVTTNTPPIQTPPTGFPTPTGSPVPQPNQPNSLTTPPSRRRGIDLRTLRGQFTTLVFLCVLLALVCAVVSYLIFGSIKSNFQEIIESDVPGVLAASDLGKAIQGTAADAANYQLYARTDVSSPDFNKAVYGSCDASKNTGLLDCTWSDLIVSRTLVTNYLYQARSNVTDANEANAVTAITSRFLDYNSAIDLMKSQLNQGNREAALAAYAQAQDILNGNIGTTASGASSEQQQELAGWPSFNTSTSYNGINANVHKLIQIKLDRLNDTYRKAQDIFVIGAILVSVAVVLLLVALGLLVLRHALVTHRIINFGYGIGLVILIVVAAFFVVPGLSNANTDYRVLAQDSFSNIDSVTQAEQLLASANAIESSYLLSPQGPAFDSTNAVLTANVRQQFDTTTLFNNFGKVTKLVNYQIDNIWSNDTHDQNALCNIAPDSNAANSCPSGSDFALQDYSKSFTATVQFYNEGLLAAAIGNATNNTNGSAFYLNTINKNLGQVADYNSGIFNNIACQAIGKNDFEPSCNGTGYVNNLQIGSLIVLPIIALLILGGYVLFRREF